MELHQAFACYEQEEPQRRTAVRQTCQALCRSGVDTLDKLRLLYRERPGEISRLRGIGSGRVALIGDILQYYEAEETPAEQLDA